MEMLHTTIQDTSVVLEILEILLELLELLEDLEHLECSSLEINNKSFCPTPNGVTRMCKSHFQF